MKYHVQIEARGFAFEVVVTAESMSEAVKIVREFHCEKRTVEITPTPTWVEPAPENPEEGYEIYEYSNQIYGDCEDCGLVLFEQGNPEGNDWPWQHTNGDDGHHTNICYPCAQKRKEAGNYCAFYENYYRDDHHHGCDSCPAGGCSKAQKAYYEKLSKVLKAALSFSKAQPSEVNEFLDHNEFGLAFAVLSESATPHQEYHIHMGSAKALIDAGWK